MKTEEQNQAIAEACGWKLFPDPYRKWWKQELTGRLQQELPNYCASLDAMHEAEKVLAEEQINKYEREIGAVSRGQAMESGPGYKLWHATAAQRAEAFLKTLNLWQE